MEQNTAGQVELTNQWNDFLIRDLDPYATSKYRIILDWLGDVRSKRCLIIGSGSGELAALLAREGADVLASDIDQPSIDLTLKTAQKLGVRIRARVARLEEFSDDEQYDIVAATDVIEHIEDDSAAARQVTSLVAPGGRLVITVPALQSLFGYHDEVLHHFRRYNRKALKTLFSPYVRFERMQYFGFFLIPIALIISRWMRRPYPVAAAGNAEKKKASPLGWIVRLLFFLERTLVFPSGTSLLFLARPK